jgi:hypothetical protein
MKTTVRKFERNRYKANNTCPCGKNNRDGKFATELGFADQPIGYCNGCAKNFWSNSDTIVKPYEIKPEDIPVFCTPDMQDMTSHFDAELVSGFAQFLIKTFGKDKAVKIVEMYYLGVLDSAHGADLNSDVIFWQIDTDKNLRAGKIIAYNDVGKRQGVPRWWHRIKGGTCQLNQCFFGEHLIPYISKPIAIVESEKTACAMTIFDPSFLWLACGSASHLQDSKCSYISKYKVTLFPDHNQYDTNSNWKAIADKWGFEISRDCEIWHEQGLISKGDDIADYYFNLTTLQQIKSLDVRTVNVDSEWNQEEYEVIFNKPKDWRSDMYTGRNDVT